MNETDKIAELLYNLHHIQEWFAAGVIGAAMDDEKFSIPQPTACKWERLWLADPSFGLDGFQRCVVKMEFPKGTYDRLLTVAVTYRLTA